MFGYMTEIDTVEMTETQEIEAEGKCNEHKADRLLMHDTLNAPWLLTNRQFHWTGNGHSQLPLAELGKPSPNIDLLRTTG